MPRHDRPALRDVMAGLIAADRQPWSLLTGHCDMDQVAERLRRVVGMPKLPDVRHLDAPADRLPLIVAHGPGFHTALMEIAANRDRVWLIAPFRSAVRLVEANVVPDVIVLAERDTWPMAASLDQWRALPADQSRRLSAATLVADAFAPLEIVTRFSRAYTFDSGLGCGTPLPLYGLGVLAGVSLALVKGHRQVGLAGVDFCPTTRLGGLLAGLAEVEEVLCRDVASCGLTAWIEQGPLVMAREELARTPPSSSHLVFARAVASRELNTLAGLIRELRAGLTYEPADVRLTSLMQRIRSRWRRHASVVAAVERAGLRWVLTLWELDTLAMLPLHASCSTQMTARLVLPELVAALEQHQRDCAACCSQNLGAPAEAVA